MSWADLDAALSEARPRDALRLAVGLWRSTRHPDLADLVDALAAFVDSDPRTAPKRAPDDPAEVDGWLAWVTDEAMRIFENDEWWTRGWQADVEAALARFESVDDPRVATAIVEFVSQFGRLTGQTERFIARLFALGDERARRRLPDELADLPRAPSLAPSEQAIVARGLARYRDEPQRLIDLVVDPGRVRDDGTEQVASDALTELGHPYGEAIALQYDAAAGIITAAGRERLTALIACHERRWLSPSLYRGTTARVYRGGLLDEITLSPRVRSEALLDPRLGRLRVLRADAGDFRQLARMMRQSPWLRGLEELDVPSLELLGELTATRQLYPKLRRIWLDRLRPVRAVEEWNEWAQPLAAWLDLLPSLEEVVFRTIPEEGLERLVEAILGERLHERITAFSLDGTRAGWSWVPRGERDPTMWFRVLDARGVRRAALYYNDATFVVEWTEAGLVVTLETSEGGDAFRLLRRLPPPRRLARLVFRDFPGRRAKRLAGLGRLRAFLESAEGAEVEMPVRWKNQLAGLP
jgi:hypothetical protein